MLNIFNLHRRIAQLFVFRPHSPIQKVKQAFPAVLAKLFNALLRRDDFSDVVHTRLPHPHARSIRLGMHDIELTIVASQLDLHSSIVSEHVGVGIFWTGGEAVEIVEWLHFCNEPALRKYWEFVIDQTERRDGVVLIDVVGGRKQLVKFSSAAALRLAVSI